jgi:hypothetical protein
VDAIWAKTHVTPKFLKITSGYIELKRIPCTQIKQEPVPFQLVALWNDSLSTLTTKIFVKCHWINIRIAEIAEK